MGRRFVAAIAVLIGVGVPIGSAGSAAAAYPGGPDGPSTACQIADSTTHVLPHPATSLQMAVNAATAGDVLRVKGICNGTTVVNKSLTIRGYVQSNNGVFNRKNPPLEWLEADGSAGSVVTIAPGVQVTLECLKIEGGSGNQQSGDVTTGGGIDNYGTLALISNNITGNSATFGGGIYNEPGATLTERSGGEVDGNSATNGGGVYLADNSVISGVEMFVVTNAAVEHGGGVYVAHGATVVTNPGPAHPFPWTFSFRSQSVGGNTPDDVFFA